MVEAYEPHEHYANLGRQIVQITGLPVRWYNKPINRSDLVDKQYDVALMLGVFQWISDGGSRLDYAKDLLGEVASSSRFLFFELGCNHGKSSIHTEERPLAWVWRLLLESASPKQVAHLGSVAPWGKARRYLLVCTEGPIRLTVWQRSITHALRKCWKR